MAWGKRDVNSRAEIDRALRRSLRAAVAGDRETAETWLERVVEADSSDLDAYHALARLYREQGSVGRAIRMHQNLLLRADLPREAHAEALLELARDFDVGGFRDRAVSAYEEVLEAQPRNVEVLERLIRLLQDSPESSSRLHSLLKRLRRRERTRADSIESEILLARAQAAMGEGDPDAARSAIKGCLKRADSTAEGRRRAAAAWTISAELEVERGKTQRALDAWKKALASDSARAAELLPKIDAGYAARGKGLAFETYLRGLLEDAPQLHAARVALARSLARRGETDESLELLSRALDVAPNSAALQAELGRQLLEAGKESEALAAYERLLAVLERTPDSILGEAELENASLASSTNGESES